MRNYFRLYALHANTSFNSNYVAIGRTPEEAATILEQAATGFGGTIVSAEPINVYFELSHDNFYELIWFGAGWLHRLTSGVNEWRVWNDGNPTTGGFLVDGSDFILFESPRRTERRRFRLVPIRKRP